MQKTRIFVFGIAVVWEAISVMLPPVVAIPFLLIGALIIAWAIWPVQIIRVIQRAPTPTQKPILDAIKWLESKLDETQTEFSTNSGSFEKTYVKFSTDGLMSIIESRNISSITDVGLGSYIIAFSISMHPDTLVVHPIGDTSRSFTVESISADAVHIVFEEEPGVIALRFDD